MQGPPGQGAVVFLEADAPEDGVTVGVLFPSSPQLAQLPPMTMPIDSRMLDAPGAPGCNVPHYSRDHHFLAGRCWSASRSRISPSRP